MILKTIILILSSITVIHNRICNQDRLLSEFAYKINLLFDMSIIYKINHTHGKR